MTSVLIVLLGLGIVAATIHSYLFGGYWTTIVMLSAVFCASALTDHFTKQRIIGKPIPWKDVEEGAPF